MIWKMPDSNPGFLPQKSGALPMSHHISRNNFTVKKWIEEFEKWTTKPFKQKNKIIVINVGSNLQFTPRWGDSLLDFNWAAAADLIDPRAPIGSLLFSLYTSSPISFYLQPLPTYQNVPSHFCFLSKSFQFCPFFLQLFLSFCSSISFLSCFFIYF